MVARDPGEAWENQRIRNIVGLCELERLEAQHRPEQNNSIKGNSVIRQVACDPRRAGRTIALTEKVQRRRPALVAREVHPDELAKGLDVPAHVPKAPRSGGIRRTAPSRA